MDQHLIQKNMVENVVKSLLTGEHLNTCLAKEALETYRIMDILLLESLFYEIALDKFDYQYLVLF